MAAKTTELTEGLAAPPPPRRLALRGHNLGQTDSHLMLTRLSPHMLNYLTQLHHQCSHAVLQPAHHV